MGVLKDPVVVLGKHVGTVIQVLDNLVHILGVELVGLLSDLGVVLALQRGEVQLLPRSQFTGLLLVVQVAQQVVFQLRFYKRPLSLDCLGPDEGEVVVLVNFLDLLLQILVLLVLQLLYEVGAVHIVEQELLADLLLLVLHALQVLQLVEELFLLLLSDELEVLLLVELLSDLLEVLLHQLLARQLVQSVVHLLAKL